MNKKTANFHTVGFAFGAREQFFREAIVLAGSIPALTAILATKLNCLQHSLKRKNMRCKCGNKIGKNATFCMSCKDDLYYLDRHFDPNNLDKVVCFALRKDPILLLAQLFIDKGMTEEQAYDQMRKENISQVIQSQVSSAVRDLLAGREFCSQDSDVNWAMRAKRH